jgi:hypothetical protein
LLVPAHKPVSAEPPVPSLILISSGAGSIIISPSHKAVLLTMQHTYYRIFIKEIFGTTIFTRGEGTVYNICISIMTGGEIMARLGILTLLYSLEALLEDNKSEKAQEVIKKVIAEAEKS